MQIGKSQESLVTLVLFAVTLVIGGGVIVWLGGASTPKGEIPSVFTNHSKLNDALASSDTSAAAEKMTPEERATSAKALAEVKTYMSRRHGRIIRNPWPCIYGPTHDAVCTDPNVSTKWKGEGPKSIWQMNTGTGYSSPSVGQGSLVLFHRIEDSEIVECLDPDTGSKRWEQKYPTAYVDRYGYNGGPRSTPIIEGLNVYTLGAEGKFHCLDLVTGKVKWQRDLKADYKVEQAFFGVGASPLLDEDRFIVNVGGTAPNTGIIAIEKTTGKTVWTATNDGASYATPRGAIIHGKRYVFVFSEAGLVSIQPATGKVNWSIPFRSKLVESVNASSPLIVDDKVLVSATYNTGSLCIRIKPDGTYEELWRDRRSLESHFSNLLHHEGYVFGISGRSENDAVLRCIDLATGKVVWQAKERVGYASMIQLGNEAILLTGDGKLISFRLSPKEFQLISKTSSSLTDSRSWAPAALADGLFYVQTESTLSCFDLRKSAR